MLGAARSGRGGVLVLVGEPGAALARRPTARPVGRLDGHPAACVGDGARLRSRRPAGWFSGLPCWACSPASADRVPLLVRVDDLQWVDAPSAEAIVFAARRLRADRVAVLIGSPPPEGTTHESLPGLLRSLPCLELNGLDHKSSHQLLSSSGVAAHVAVQLSQRTGGNPLALLEVTALRREC